MTASKPEGFTPRTLDFLHQLSANNHREWFADNKQTYEADVVAPALAFIAAMQAPLRSISKQFLAVPKKIGGSMMRIHRDTRFSALKTPYKTNIGIQFRHQQGKDVHAPGFYLHIEPTDIFLGVGIWRPEAAVLAHLRQSIVDDSRRWVAARDAAYAHGYSLRGSSLQRVPRGFDAEHPLIADIKRKDFIAIRDLSVDDIYQPNFVSQVADSFADCKALMRFLCKAVGVPF